MKNPNRLKFLQIAVCIGLIAGILFSHELWFSRTRTFPRAPLIFEVPVAFEQILSFILILIVSLIFTGFLFRRKIFSIFALASLILLIFFDQNRLQPWVYQYLLILAVLALSDSEDETAFSRTLGLVQIIIAGLYFWSGAQKLNFTFSHETLPPLLAPLENLFPSFQPPFVFIGIGIALVESLIGCGLLFRKTRNLSVWLAIAMHAIVLGFLIAKNYNSIVWIWNAALIPIVFISFWRSNISLKQTIRTPADWKIKIAKSIAAASVLLPILSFAGWWDMYLSGALYSGNTEIAVIRINEELLEKLPPKARQIVFETKSNNEKMLPLFEWAINELNVPAYPQRRVSRAVAREVCNLTEDKNQIELIVKERPAILDGSYKVSRIGCAELEKR